MHAGAPDAQIRTDSRAFARIRTSQDSRRMHGKFTRIRGRFTKSHARFAADSRKIRSGFTRIRDRFAAFTGGFGLRGVNPCNVLVADRVFKSLTISIFMGLNPHTHTPHAQDSGQGAGGPDLGFVIVITLPRFGINC